MRRSAEGTGVSRSARHRFTPRLESNRLESRELLSVTAAQTTTLVATLTPTPGGSSTAPPPPLEISSVVPLHQGVTGKRHATRGSAKLIGFTVAFSGQDPDTARANSTGNYTLLETEGKGKKAHEKMVAVTADYSSSTNTVNLVFSGKQSFASGGELNITPASSAGTATNNRSNFVLSSGGIASDIGIIMVNGEFTGTAGILTGMTNFTIGRNGKKITANATSPIPAPTPTPTPLIPVFPVNF